MVWEGPGRASVAGASRDSPISRDRRAGGEVVSGFAALAQATAFSAGKGRPGSQRFKAARWAEQARRRPVRHAASPGPGGGGVLRNWEIRRRRTGRVRAGLVSRTGEGTVARCGRVSVPRAPES